MGEERTIDSYFIDWHASAFGFGYGTGEEHTLPALKQFLSMCSRESYDYRELEAAMTPTVAWLMINIAGRNDLIEYGSSPRFAWLTEKGIALKAYVDAHSFDELYDLVGGGEAVCMPDACNCGPDGYDEGKRCPNPFWNRDAALSLPPSDPG